MFHVPYFLLVEENDILADKSRIFKMLASFLLYDKGLTPKGKVSE